MLDRPAFKAGDLYLGHMQDPCAVLLCHSMIIPQRDHLAFFLRQRLDRSAQSHMFHKLFLCRIVAEDMLQGETIFPILPLDAVGRAGRRLGESDLFRTKTCLLRKFREERLSPLFLFQANAAGADPGCLPLIVRLTFTAPSSRRKRRISPEIFGTA